MGELKNLKSVGLTLPSPAYLFGVILFGIIGFALYRLGKKTSEAATKWVGITMMLFPMLFLRHGNCIPLVPDCVSVYILCTGKPVLRIEMLLLSFAPNHADSVSVWGIV